MSTRAATVRRYLPWGVPGVLALAALVTGNDVLFGTAVVLVAVLVFVMLVRGLRAQSAREAQDRQIWADGTPARARVLAITATGSRRHENPVVLLDLEVSGHEPSRVQLRVLVSLVALPRVQPDCEVDVRIDPQDASRVVLDPGLTP